MKYPQWSRLAAMMIAAVMAACTQPDSTPVGPRIGRAASRTMSEGQAPVGHEALWAYYAKQVPGFGGMYFNDDGDLVVVLTDITQTAASASVLAGYVGQSHRPKELPTPHQPRMLFAPGRYDYLELLQYKDAASRSLAASSVARQLTTVAIDEIANDVVFGVEAGVAVSAAKATAVASGAPANAIRVVQAERSRATTDTIQLTNTVTPLVGGNRIWVGGTFCTLGIPVNYQTVSTFGFLTAAHCVWANNLQAGDTLFELADSTTNLTTSSIGTLVDGDYSTFTCSHGSNCKWADAALVGFKTGVTFHFGAVAHGYDVAVGPGGGMSAIYWASHYGQAMALDHRTYWGSSNGPFEMDAVSNGSEVVGQWVSKIGITTGWTYGKIYNANMDDLTTSGFWILHSVRVNAGVYQGDSGSPVWWADGHTKADGNLAATFLGIVFAGDSTITDRGHPAFRYYNYSPMSLISTALGNSIGVY
jgi:hypothetical protein